MQKLSEKAYKNKISYINEYSKNNQKKIGVTFNLKEFEEFQELLNKLENKKSYKYLIFKGLKEELKNQKK